MTGMPILMVVDVTPWSAGLDAPACVEPETSMDPSTTTMLAMVANIFRMQLGRCFSRSGSVRSPPQTCTATSSATHPIIATSPSRPGRLTTVDLRLPTAEVDILYDSEGADG